MTGRRLIASFLGTGLLLRRFTQRDAGSGTVAAGVALLMVLTIRPARLGWQVGLLLITVAFGTWAIADFARTEKDPGWIVIDEVAGTLLATLGTSGWAAVAGWAVFRVADINKRLFPGVAAAERIPNAWGVMADDLVAGVYGLAAGLLVGSFV
jgi:phosphatidylglycerophosphatase A